MERETEQVENSGRAKAVLQRGLSWLKGKALCAVTSASVAWLQRGANGGLSSVVTPDKADM